MSPSVPLLLPRLSEGQLLGCQTDHVVPLVSTGAKTAQTAINMHVDVIGPLTELIDAARQAGFDLQVASGFRHFDRQLLIWNNKCEGQRPVFDSNGNLLDMATLSAEEKLMAILRWSALPGASRHHWGTDCDIYDAAAIDDDYVLQLHPDEYIGNGPFAPMMEWLASYIEQPHAPDFYRPYWRQGNHPSSQVTPLALGVASEPWHLSYRPVAQHCEQQLTLTILREHIQRQSSLAEQKTVLLLLDKVYEYFVAAYYSSH